MGANKSMIFICIGLSFFIQSITHSYQILKRKNSEASYERSLVVVTASYNNKDWFERNLDSIFMQSYSNYRLIYIDDCSTDGTYELVSDYINNYNHLDKTTIIKNESKVGALANQYKAIHSCKDDEIILILDGDDWFAHDQVFSFINDVYRDPNVWITYGQFKEYPSGDVGFCCPMPEDIMARNAYREYGHTPSHLRTFYAGLFKMIKKEDLCIDEEFMPMTGDIAAMFPMLEMAGDRFKFIDEVLYVYNTTNPISDHLISKKLQRVLDLYLRAKPRYNKLDHDLFSEKRIE